MRWLIVRWCGPGRYLVRQTYKSRSDALKFANPTEGVVPKLFSSEMGDIITVTDLQDRFYKQVPRPRKSLER